MSHRYQRHTMIDWFDQDRIAKARIIVVGAGAVGNEVLKNLALLGAGDLHIIDFDRIEEHNLTKCVLFRDEDIGQTKADVAARSCRRIDPNIQLKSTCGDFWDALSLREIAAADAVICCVDNIEARLGLNRLCRLANTDFYNTGIDSRHASVELFPFSPDVDCACFACNLPSSAFASMQERFSCGYLRKAAFEERKIPTTAVTSSLAGAAVASIVLQRLNDHPHKLASSIRYFIDSITLASSLTANSPNPECAVCRDEHASPSIVAARRLCDDRQMMSPGDDRTTQVEFSEPVLLDTTCSGCGRTQEFKESVRRLTDAVHYCTGCGATSIRTRIVEKMSTEEFLSVFAGGDVPVKFLSCRENECRFIIEMEE